MSFSSVTSTLKLSNTQPVDTKKVHGHGLLVLSTVKPKCVIMWNKLRIKVNSFIFGEFYDKAKITKEINSYDRLYVDMLLLSLVNLWL